MSTKRIVIGLGVVIAIALGIASFTGVIPPKNGVMGTIGAAKRYQTTQISAGDVTLTDAEMQDLLQSDVFHQLVTDANFREVMRTQSESFRTVLLDKQFRDRDAQLYGVSTDSEFVHLAWRKSHEDLRNLPFPMLSDLKRELVTALGVLDPEAGVAQRATFIVDPQGIVRFVYVTDLSVGRSPEEVLRVLDALQTDELCPCNWQKGEDTLQAA